MTDKPYRKGPSGDAYDLSPMAFAKHCGFVIPKNDGRNVGYHSLLTIGLGLYYDVNTHLSRPHDLAA